MISYLREVRILKIPLVSVPYHGSAKKLFFAVKTIKTTVHIEGEKLSLYERIQRKLHYIYYLTKEERKQWWKVNWQEREKKIVKALVLAALKRRASFCFPVSISEEEFEEMIEQKAYYNGVIKKKRRFLKEVWENEKGRYSPKELVFFPDGSAHYCGVLVNIGEYIEVKRVFGVFGRIEPGETIERDDSYIPILIFNGTAYDHKLAEEGASEAVLAHAREILKQKMF